MTLIPADFDPKPDPEIEKCLLELLELARSGKMDGMAFAYTTIDEPVSTFGVRGRTGTQLVGALAWLQHRIMVLNED